MRNFPLSSTFFTFGPAEMLDGAFFLARLQLQIDAPVMMFAEFRLKLRDELPQIFPVPRHHFHEQQSHDRSDQAFRQIKFRPRPRRIPSPPSKCPAPSGQLPLQMYFKSDRRLKTFLPYLSAILSSIFVEENAFATSPERPARPRQMPKQNGEKSGAA